MTISESILPSPIYCMNVISDKLSILYYHIQVLVGCKRKESTIDNRQRLIILLIKLRGSKSPVFRCIGSKLKFLVFQISYQVISSECACINFRVGKIYMNGRRKRLV